MKVFKILFIGLVVISLFVGCVDETTKMPTVPGSNNKSDNEAERKIFNRNETVSFKTVNYSIINIKKSSGSEWDTPPDGKEYIIVTIKIENKSNSKISYNAFDWKMQNSQGQEDDEAFTTIDSDTALNSGDLLIGGVKEGTITFTEPKNDPDLRLNFYDNMFNENYSFQIKLQ